MASVIILHGCDTDSVTTSSHSLGRQRRWVLFEEHSHYNIGRLSLHRTLLLCAGVIILDAPMTARGADGVSMTAAAAISSARIVTLIQP